MLKFKYTKVAGQRTLSLTPEKVPGMLRAMQKRATWEGVIISPDAKLGLDGEGQFPILSLGWYPGFGYEALCMELKSDGHFVATSRKLSAPEVYVELGGQGQELWPRELFVPYAIAEQAVLYVLETGRRDPSLKWVGISAFPRKKVRARRRSTGSPSGSASDA
jgi:hypothetical protein